MPKFKQTIPSDLIAHVTEMCGAEGEKWLEALPSTIGSLEEAWDVEISPPFPAIEFNYVAPAVRRNGESVVIKVAPPFESTEIFSEAKYLGARDGRGCIRLLAEHADLKAIMIERALPGESLTEHFSGREPDCVAPAITVLKTILMPPPPDMTNVISLDDWFDGMTRYPGTDFPASYARRALELYEAMSAEPGRTHYLHGDFHPGNVVTATREPFMAIDPKGMVGHLGYEIAVFLNNLHWWQDWRPDVRERLASSVGEFSKAFDIDPLRLRQWAYIQMVLSAWWMFDEAPNLYDNDIVKADIWEV